jgi:hypothetical protein
MAPYQSTSEIAKNPRGIVDFRKGVVYLPPRFDLRGG